jgi:hypothetical protein
MDQWRKYSTKYRVFLVCLMQKSITAILQIATVSIQEPKRQSLDLNPSRELPIEILKSVDKDSQGEVI